MAFFENQLVEVFFTPKKSSTMIEDLKKYGTRDMKSLRLVPHPSLRLLQFHRPVHKAKALVVFNQGGTVYWRPVAKSEWVCLQRLLKGDSVADLAQLAKKNKLSAKKTQSMTKTWTEDGLVLGLKPLSTKVPKAQSRF
jgi:hypothetical protein